MDKLQLQSKEIQQSLINTIQRMAEKTVSQSKITKTILATIQYCIDKTNGQYKIKYQNGYFTAYAQGEVNEYTYSSGSLVYVLVPNGDMNGRLLIIGSASNSSNDKIYLTNLEDEQMYKVNSGNMLISQLGENKTLNLSTYSCTGPSPEEEYTKYYYQAGADNNYFTIDTNLIQLLQKSEYFRLGVRFQTKLKEDRNENGTGDYGIRIVITYINDKNEEEDRSYELNTFMMSGSPFHFTQPVPQYAFWEIPNTDNTKLKIKQIKSIAGFVRGFEESLDEPFDDILVSDLSLQAAKKLYNKVDDIYRVGISSEQGFMFDIAENIQNMDLKATFYIRGNEVADPFGQGLEFFWGKKDSQVNTTSNPRYCEELGMGWYCLNPCALNTSNAQTIAELKDDSTVTISSDYPLICTRDKLTYITNVDSIFLPRVLSMGKETNVKCVVKYGGSLYESEEIAVYNPNGYYVLLSSLDNKKIAYNGSGYFTLGAGVFKDIPGADIPDNSMTLDSRVTYKWAQLKDGQEIALPYTKRSDIASTLLFNLEWSSDCDATGKNQYDNEMKTDEEVASYLNGDELKANCIERFSYYDKKMKSYNKDDQQQSTYYTRCKQRSNAIITWQKNKLQSYYNSNYENTQGYFITGPSRVTAKYLQDITDGAIPSFINAEIDSIEPEDNIPVEQRDQVFNTLYKVPASKIGLRTTFRVSAILTQNNSSYEIGTQTINLVNEAGSTLDYYVDIINGDQTFIYDERGLSPTANTATQPDSAYIQPLHFVLYNKEGTVLFDSSKPEEYPNIDINDLKPNWYFVDNNFSLITTNYQNPAGAPASEGTKYASKTAQFDTDHLWKLPNESFFYFNLRKDYDSTCKDTSNIELELIYEGSIISGSTSFTFSKQGELGTNGTNRILTINSPTYNNNYREPVLAQQKYSYLSFKTKSKSDNVDTSSRYYGPSARHLANPYLFATNNYASLTRVEGRLQPCSIDDGRYVNLSIAQLPHKDGDIINIEDSSTAQYRAEWNYIPDTNSTITYDWEVTKPPKSDITVGNMTFHYQSVFTLSGATNSDTATLQLSRTSLEPDLSVKPYYINALNERTIAHNIIRASSSVNIDGRDFRNFAYCGIPYYYFNWTYRNNGGEMPNNIDPARHISIVGGFDQVMYDSTGHNPSYNSQTPFRFYIYDENERNITNEVIEAALANNPTAVIQWRPSPGLQIRQNGLSTIRQASNYTDLGNEIKENQICIYNNVYYKCTHAYFKNTSTTVSYPDGSQHVYEQGEFIPAFWTEIDQISYAQDVYIIPAATYESMYEQTLLNSWVELTIQYDKYEAQVILPINIYCNSYESPELNAWDGKSIVMDDDGEQSYLITNKVSAGIKDRDNQFVGISIGENIRYVTPSGSGTAQPESSVGLFGFGYGKNTPNPGDKTKQTLFLDAKTGLAAFGPSGASQIILDPNPENWSRLAGWYFSKDYLYKPVTNNEGDVLESQGKYSNLMAGKKLEPSNLATESFGIYVPSSKSVSSNTIAIWAGTGRLSGISGSPPSGTQFSVTYGGKLHATNVEVTGAIKATSGHFGDNTDKVSINYTFKDHKYVLYHKNFWVESNSTSSETDSGGQKISVGIRGKIMAESGQIGKTNASTDGKDPQTIFLHYKWYPWVTPADGEPFQRDVTYYLDTKSGKTITYLLYHPRFSVDTTGEVRVDGTIFSQKGRIGGWVIKDDRLKSYTGDVNICSDGHANFGSFYINPNGSIGGPTWSINENGVASFSNPDNTYVGSSVKIGKGVWGQGGLVLPEGEHFKIGNTADMTATSSGFVFTGNSTYNGRLTMGTGQTLALESGATLNFGTGLNLDSSGIHIGTYSIDNSGQANLQNVTVGNTLTTNIARVNSLYIGSSSLEDYIRSIVGSMGFLTGYTTAPLGTLGDSSRVVMSVY